MKDETKEAEGKSDKERKKIKKATESLLWLTRGLSFTCKGLEKARKDKEQSLAASFQAAYSETLEKYHGFLVKKAIGVFIYSLLFIALVLIAVLPVARFEGMPDSGDIVREIGRRGSRGISFCGRRSQQRFGDMAGGFRIDCQAHSGLLLVWEIRRRFCIKFLLFKLLLHVRLGYKFDYMYYSARIRPSLFRYH